MTVILPRAALAATLAEASRIVEKRNTIPILANVLIEVDNGRATIAVTDLDLDYRSTLPIDDFAARLSITLPAEILKNIAAKAEGDDLAITVDDKGAGATIKSGKARWRMMALPASDFPPPCSIDFAWRFALPPKVLAASLAATAFAAEATTGKSSRPYLQGVHMRAHGDGHLHFVATNGHVLSLAAVALPVFDAGEAQTLPGVSIPSKTVAALAKIADNSEAPVVVEVDPDRLRFTAMIGGRTIALATKLLEGTFPDYRRVVPSAPVNVAGVPRERLMAAATRVMMVDTERGHAVRLDFGGDGLTIATRSRSGENSEEEVGGAFDFQLSIGCNGRYLDQILGSLPGETVDIGVTDPGSAMLITIAGRGDRKVVLMPMRAPGKAEADAP